MTDEYVESEVIESEVPEPEEVPVMIFFEEAEHLRLMIRTKSGVITRYLTKEHATQMMKWIGVKGTDIKSDVIVML
jgi:hypothetical protein